MAIDIIRDIAIDELMQSPAGEWLEKAVEKVSDVQRVVLALSEKEEDEKLTLLKIGTVFQIFLVDTLASGKKVKDLKEEDWKSIADKVAK